MAGLMHALTVEMGRRVILSNVWKANLQPLFAPERERERESGTRWCCGGVVQTQHDTTASPPLLPCLAESCYRCCARLDGSESAATRATYVSGLGAFPSFAF